MNEMVFDGIMPLFDYLKSRGGASAESHGAMGQFYRSMQIYNDPNTCGCKKGKRALDTLNQMYSRLHVGLTNENSSSIRALFDNNTVVLKLNGAEVGRF